MSYKIKHFLFGWDYIVWKNSVHNGISRVFKTADNKVVYWRYKRTFVLDEVKTADQVYWLTCHPSKFGL